jgi:uncharacterized protein (TIGR00251 family)
MVPVRDSPHGATFAIRVHPRAKQTGITGVFGEGDSAAVKVALAAPPVDGRANQEVVNFFADLFRVARGRVVIVSGETSRSKVVRVAGKSSSEILAKLPELVTS